MRAAFAKGEIVIVTDDNDRENEGDLFIAASLCTPEKMAFIIRHTSGIVCAPLSAQEAKRLRLDPMVALNDAPLGTAFTVSVDVRHGLTTGISAEERTHTVRALANHNSGPSDFVRPGHVFPLIAKEGGVLMRSGHTEACIDLCRLAGVPPVGVLSELMNDDGSVTRGPQLAVFAEQHGLKTISVADLIAYRQARDKLMARGRIGRADPQRPRHFLDPAVVLDPAHLCGPRRLRHRDRLDRGAGGVKSFPHRYRHGRACPGLSRPSTLLFAPNSDRGCPAQ